MLQPTASGVRPIVSFLIVAVGLLVEPLANRQRESREQGHRVRQHHANALLPHNAVDEALKCARLGSAIHWAAATPAVSADNVLPARTGSYSDPTPQIKDGCIVEFR